MRIPSRVWFSFKKQKLNAKHCFAGEFNLYFFHAQQYIEVCKCFTVGFIQLNSIHPQSLNAF